MMTMMTIMTPMTMLSMMTMVSMIMMLAMKGWCKDRRAAPPWKVPGILLTLLIGDNVNIEDDKFLRKGVKMC